LITDVVICWNAAFIAQDQVVERLKMLPHPVTIHGRILGDGPQQRRPRQDEQRAGRAHGHPGRGIGFGARSLSTGQPPHRRSMSEHEEHQTIVPAPTRGKIHEGLERAEQGAFTRPIPKSPQAQVRFLLQKAKGSTRGLAERLGLSKRTVQRIPPGRHLQAAQGHAGDDRAGDQAGLAAPGPRPGPGAGGQ
jgi:hypothetical protein